MYKLGSWRGLQLRELSSVMDRCTLGTYVWCQVLLQDARESQHVPALQGWAHHGMLGTGTA
jgi:hypothetical protein